MGAALDQPFAALPLGPACPRIRQTWVRFATPFAPVSPATPFTTSSLVTPTFGVAYISIPIEEAVPDPALGAGLLLTATELFSKLQAAIVPADATLVMEIKLKTADAVNFAI